MIVAELALFGMVLRLYYLIAIVFDLIVVILIILEGGITSQDASIHSETATLVGAETVLMAPQPTG
jgi:drug/metabolite transporter (DMT)-like permease